MFKSRSKIVGLVFLLAFATNVCLGQLVPEDLLLEPSDLLQAEFDGQVGTTNSNISLVKQLGDGNEAEVIQQLGGDRNGGNLVRLLQSGDFNLAIVRQNGNRNQLALVQRGTENVYELTVNGYGNNINIVQEGRGNKIIQDLNDINDFDIELIQIGNNNEIVQVLEGYATRSIKIIQEGDDMQLRVEQSSY